MTLDIAKLQHEVTQLGQLEADRIAAQGEKDEAEGLAMTAEANLQNAINGLNQAQALVTAQIGYITGLLGVTPPTTDPTPDPDPEPPTE